MQKQVLLIPSITSPTVIIIIIIIVPSTENRLDLWKTCFSTPETQSTTVVLYWYDKYSAMDSKCWPSLDGAQNRIVGQDPTKIRAYDRTTTFHSTPSFHRS